MINGNYVLGLIVLFAIVSCTDGQTRKICGKWQAVDVQEEGEQVQVELSDVGFIFYDNGFYNYNSSNDYHEAGTYSIRGDLLYTLDTINKASSEKAVQIINLTKDTLQVKMMAHGKEQTIKFAKLN